MISTITTATTTTAATSASSAAAATTTAVTSADILGYSLIAVVALIVFLALKEILSSEAGKNSKINTFINNQCNIFSAASRNNIYIYLIFSMIWTGLTKGGF